MSGAQRHQFRIEPLTTAAERRALEVWIAAAAPGDSTVYATGPALPHGHETVKLVQVLNDRGVLQLNLKRRGDRHGFDFLATKMADPLPVSPKADRSALSEAKCVRVLAALTERARAGGEMQSNQELARECTLKNADEASYQLRKLIARKAIRVEDFGPNERRVVTIVATGTASVRGRL